MSVSHDDGVVNTVRSNLSKPEWTTPLGSVGCHHCAKKHDTVRSLGPGMASSRRSADWIIKSWPTSSNPARLASLPKQTKVGSHRVYRVDDSQAANDQNADHPFMLIGQGRVRHSGAYILSLSSGSEWLPSRTLRYRRGCSSSMAAASRFMAGSLSVGAGLDSSRRLVLPSRDRSSLTFVTCSSARKPEGSGPGPGPREPGTISAATTARDAAGKRSGHAPLLVMPDGAKATSPHGNSSPQLRLCPRGGADGRARTDSGAGGCTPCAAGRFAARPCTRVNKSTRRRQRGRDHQRQHPPRREPQRTSEPRTILRLCAGTGFRRRRNWQPKPGRDGVKGQGTRSAAATRVRPARPAGVVSIRITCRPLGRRVAARSATSSSSGRFGAAAAQGIGTVLSRGIQAHRVRAQQRRLTSRAGDPESTGRLPGLVP